LVPLVVYVALIAAVVVSFWSSLVEATYLTLRPFSLSSPMEDGKPGAIKAFAIVNEKTKLVSVTTFVDTIANVTLASSVGLILSFYFGPLGWVYSALIGSFVIMTLLYLLPKAIGIENALRMAIRLAPSSHVILETLSPIAVPLTSFARALSKRLVGKATYSTVDLVDEFEDVVTMLEKGGHIEPDAGKIIRTAVASSRRDAIDAITPMDEIVSVPSDATILDALKLMGETNHPRMPVYDHSKNLYLGIVTFRTMSKAIAHGLLNESIHNYMIQPAKVAPDDSLATVTEKMQDSATTLAFVFDGEKMMGVISLSDIIEQVMGIKV
jgi:magnesium and cobalt exporter, CNNM family